MSRVYSTDLGRICPSCDQPVAQCQCKTQTGIPGGDGIVRISRETKGRKGKGVTLVKGISLTETELKSLAKKLKQKLSTGGSVKDGILEFQGDQRATLKTLLEQEGFQVKLAGG